ncbi:M16 family metallopeptidase [Litoreibacter arenae]|uniref:Peptidase, M16 family n=1 Tax=Litoreibacter arenae DSM 19593 TaxID=1123360 RepID=S9RIB9_9RHOB|nr:pitrilysin family protein [Litoreibacter arenae]EPX77860.1 Peptidase, M16 family [Litoreibacter arenae DSM 19593]
MIRVVLTTCFALIALPAAAIDIKEVTSPGGIKAWLVEEHSIPFTALEIRFKGGASLDREDKRGAAHLMSGLLDEGAGELDSTEFASAAEALALKYGFDASSDSFSVSAQFLTENRDASVDLLRKAINEPRFDQPAVDRVRGQVLSIIASEEEDPNDIASKTFAALAYGDHPYATKLEGTAESVTALTREDLIQSHQDLLTRDRVFVGAVGDITAEELGVILDELLGNLPETGPDLPGPAPFLLDGGETIVPYDTPQSVAIFGHEGIERDDPDFFAAYVMNQVLGSGGFGSRLMDEVREKRGLTYGVYSYLVLREHVNLVMGQVSSSNDSVAEAISVIRGEWAKMADEGVTAEELERAKTYLTGAYPLRFDGNARIANILAAMQFDDLPIGYIDSRNDQVEAVTQDDIKSVAKRLLKPENLHFVVVGQPTGLDASN